MMLKHKMVFLFVVFLIGFGLINVYVVWREITTSITVEMLNFGKEAVLHLRESMIEDVLSNNLLTIQDKVESFMKRYPQVRYVYLIGSDGALILHTFEKGFPKSLMNLNTPDSSLSIKTILTNDGKVYEISTVLVPGVGGELHVGLSEEYVLHHVNKAIMNMVFFGAFVVGIGGVTVLVSMRVIIYPLKELEEGVKKIMMGFYNHRIKIFGADELGYLSTAFNKMLEDLEMKNKQVQEYVNKLKTTLRSLKKSKERYKRVIESVGDGIITLSREGVILSYNRRAEELTGMKCSDAIGKRVDEILRIPIKLEVEDPVGTEVSFRNDRGDNVFLKIFIKKLTSDYGEWAIILRDITDEVIKNELNKKLLRYEQLLSIGELMVRIAHEINTPLTSILLSTELLLMKCKNRKMKEKLEEIISKVEICKERVNELMKLARTGAAIKRELIDIAKLIDDSISYCQACKCYGNFSIVKNYEYGKYLVIADPTGLREVFENIILNAFQAMRDHGVLTIDIKDDNEFVYVYISDTGVGIPEENIHRIFEPFFTTKKGQGNLGLGLSIANAIVKAHRGEIFVESKVGKGSTFIIKLPRGFNI